MQRLSFADYYYATLQKCEQLNETGVSLSLFNGKIISVAYHVKSQFVCEYDDPSSVGEYFQYVCMQRQIFLKLFVNAIEKMFAGKRFTYILNSEILMTTVCM